MVQLFLFDVVYEFGSEATLAGKRFEYTVISITNDSVAVFKHFEEVLNGKIISCILSSTITFDAWPTFIMEKVKPADFGGV